jgi:hypothetical protein
MDSHVTYIQTQGHKSLGLPIRVTANRASGTQGLKEMKMKMREGKGIRQVNDKKMAIQEDQDGDIWSTN